eukprot:g3230.t1
MIFNKSTVKAWDATQSDLSKYKLSPEEVMRRKQSRRTPVNSGPASRRKKAVARPDMMSANAASPSQTPMVRDSKGNVAWVPSGRNTKTPTRASLLKSPSAQAPSPSDEDPVSRVTSHHSSLSQTNQAWERSRIERSASKKAAAAIAKAESRAKQQSMHLKNVDMNRLEQAFFELQGQFDKLRRLSGRSQEWCKFDAGELGKQENIVSYVESLVLATSSVCSVLSEHEIRFAQEQEERQSVQEALMAMQNDILRIRDQQNQGQNMMEFLAERTTTVPATELSAPQSPSKSISVQVHIDKEKAEREEAEAFFEEPAERYNDFQDVENFQDAEFEAAQDAEFEAAEEALAMEEEKVYDQIHLLEADDLRSLIESEGIMTTEDQSVTELRHLLIALMNTEEQAETTQTAPLPMAVPMKPVDAPDSSIGRVSYAEYMDRQSGLV